MPDQHDLNQTLRLETAMQEALQGSKPAARAFYEMLPDALLFVPERHQAQPLSNAPQYPNEFFNLLGVQDRDRVVMPAFTQISYIFEWCGSELAWREVSLRGLQDLLPEEWWVVINPGREVEKELSPWELSRLKEGPRAIDEIMEEAFAVEMAETLEVRPVDDGEYVELCSALRRAGKEHPGVSRVCLLREEGKNADGQALAHLLVGVEAPESNPDEIESLRAKFLDAARPAMIGREDLRVVIGQDMHRHPAIGVFKDARPVYERSALAAAHAFWDRLIRGCWLPQK